MFKFTVPTNVIKSIKLFAFDKKVFGRNNLKTICFDFSAYGFNVVATNGHICGVYHIPHEGIPTEFIGEIVLIPVEAFDKILGYIATITIKENTDIEIQYDTDCLPIETKQKYGYVQYKNVFPDKIVDNGATQVDLKFYSLIEKAFKHLKLETNHTETFFTGNDSRVVVRNFKDDNFIAIVSYLVSDVVEYTKPSFLN